MENASQQDRAVVEEQRLAAGGKVPEPGSPVKLNQYLVAQAQAHLNIIEGRIFRAPTPRLRHLTSHFLATRCAAHV
jgi:hypothetical protein